MTKTRCGIAAAGLMLALLPAAPALAKTSTAHYAISARGTEVTTWHLRLKRAVQGCTLYQQGDGDQTIRFRMPKPLEVTVTRKPGEHPDFNRVLVLDATAERSADFRSNRPQSLGPAGCTKTVDNPVYHQPGCGERTGAVLLNLGFTEADVADGDDDPVPAPLVAEHNRLHLRGSDPDFGAGAGLFKAFASCPLMIDKPTRMEANGELIEATDRLREASVPGRARHIAVHAAKVENYAIPGGTGRTIVTYNLTLRRVP